MTANASKLSRRRVLAGSGALIVSFSSVQGLVAQPQQSAADTNNDRTGPQVLPGSLEGAPYLDSWIRIDTDGKVTAFTGKAELGQGIKTAVLQIVAEQLDIEFSALRLITAEHVAYAERALHLRQPLHAGQWHSNPQCCRSGAPDSYCRGGSPRRSLRR